MNNDLQKGSKASEQDPQSTVNGETSGNNGGVSTASNSEVNNTNTTNGTNSGSNNDINLATNNVSYTRGSS